MQFVSKYAASLFVFVFSLCASTSLSAKETTVVRAAIDIGSGGPKLRIAEIDTVKNKIITILKEEQYPVIFQEWLSSGSDRVLSPEIMFRGIQAIKQAIALAHSYQAKGIVMIGTSVFRNAVNGKQFAQSIALETGLSVHVLDQEMEGKLAFEAALAQKGMKSDSLVVWDIGGGSTQFVGSGEDDACIVDCLATGSGPFRDYIIESIQHRYIKEHRSPNPISQEQAHLALLHASFLATKVDSVFRDKLQNPETHVVGVGSVLGRGLASLMPGKHSVTLEDLQALVKRLIGKSDADLGGGNFALVEVSNALLALGFMKELAVKEMGLMDVNNADGAMLHKPFWE